MPDKLLRAMSLHARPRFFLAFALSATLCACSGGAGAPTVGSTPPVTATAAQSATPAAPSSATPTVMPTAAASLAPVSSPTAEPTAAPTAVPTASPTSAPTPTSTPTRAATPSPTPSARATASPTSAPTARATATATAAAPIAAYVCPTSDAGIFTSSASRSLGDARRMPARSAGSGESSNLIAVSYERSFAQSATTAIASREHSLGASLLHSLDFPRLGLITRVLRVPASQLASVQASLRAQGGVRAVSIVGARRWALGVNTAYYPNDPYFDGFTAQNGQASTFHVAPYDESASVPGQWDMHAIMLEHAFEYSQPNNGSTVMNPAALGSSNVKIAIIDTGEDANHPEL
ncbi:MAG TPA: hypothetical protein VGD50_00720, partial [Candidatus Baltobacteraceae bacterium]